MCLCFRLQNHGGCPVRDRGFRLEHRFCIADCGRLVQLLLFGLIRFHFIVILVQRRFHFCLVRGRFSFVGYSRGNAAAVYGQFVLAGRWFYKAFPRYFWLGAAIAVLFKLGNAVA